MITIIESNMQFGKYREEDVFHIETCKQYQNNLKPNGVKCCEFVLKRMDTLYFVEAKTSCPNQITADSTEEKRKKYNEYIAEIDEVAMPSELRRAHQVNDRAVMEAYGFDWRKMTESECVAELMKLYQRLVDAADAPSSPFPKGKGLKSSLPAENLEGTAPPKRSRKKKTEE